MPDYYSDRIRKFEDAKNRLQHEKKHRDMKQDNRIEHLKDIIDRLKKQHPGTKGMGER